MNVYARMSGCARSRRRQPNSSSSATYFGGELSDPELLPKYALYTRVKASLALPLERVAALHAAKVGDRKKH
jgi:hypothetical protein